MAGVLAPTISEVGASASAPSLPADTSIGDALSAAGNIFGAIAETAREEGGGGSATQTERDRAGFQPFVSSLQRLKRARDNNHIGSREYRIKFNNLYSQATAAFPDKVNMINDTFGSITGETVGEPVDSAPQSFAEFRAAALSDPNNHTARALYFQSVVMDPETGGVDEELTDTRWATAMAEHESMLAGVEQMRVQKERLTLRGEISNLEQDTGTEDFFAYWSNAANKTMNSVVEAIPMVFDNTELPPADMVEEGITELTATRDQIVTQATSLAANSGIVDNLRKKFGDDWEDQLVVGLNSGIRFLERLKAEPEGVIAQMEKRENIAAIKALREAGVTAPATLLNGKNEVLTNFLLQQFNTEFKTGIRNLNTNDILSTTPTDRAGMNTDDLVDEEGNTTPAYDGAKQQFNTNEMREQVRVGMAQFKAITEVGDDPFTVKKLTNEFIIAANTMNGLKVAEDTFDRVYDNKFFETYSLLDAQKADVMPGLNNAIALNLGSILTQRKVAAETGLRTVVGDQLPSFQLAFDGQEFTVINTNPGKTQNLTVFESRIKPFLEEHGLDFTLDGLRELRVLERDQAPALGLNQFLGEVNDELRYLNKIVGTINKFPDAIRSQLQIEKTRLPRTISSQKEYEELEFGEEYEVEYSDGSVWRLPKGKESSVTGPIR